MTRTLLAGSGVIALVASLAVLDLGRAEAQSSSRAQELRRTREKIAELYEAKDDLAKSLAVWQELLAVQPLSRVYVDNVSRLAVALDRYAEALEPTKTLVARFPHSEKYRRRLVDTLVGLKAWPALATHLEWLTKRTPTDPKVRLQLAELYEEIKRPRQALDHYDWLIARGAPRKKMIAYRLSRAGLYADLGRSRDQLRELREVQKLAPKDAAVAAAIIEYSVDEGELGRADADIARALTAAKGSERRALQALSKKVEAQRRRRVAEQRERERYQDWLLDIEQRWEDF